MKPKTFHHWKILLLSLSIAGALLIGRGAVAAATNAVPTGVLTKHALDQSTIFPGTTREYWVYVPAQYDGSKPACVHVEQDGVQFNMPAIFDQLDASPTWVLAGRTLARFSPPAATRFSNAK